MTGDLSFEKRTQREFAVLLCFSSVRITTSALKVITGLVEGEMQRWYSYTDMIRETAAALKEDRA